MNKELIDINNSNIDFDRFIEFSMFFFMFYMCGWNDEIDERLFCEWTDEMKEKFMKEYEENIRKDVD